MHEGHHMTPEMLEQAGTALFGDSWKARLAVLLDRHPKAVQRYMTKSLTRRVPIPEEHRVILVKALRQKHQEVELALNILLHAAEDGSLSMEYFDAAKRKPTLELR
jgi:hypothetical protein